MPRKGWIKFIFLFAIIFMAAMQNHAQRSSNQTRKKTVDSFLTAWLVRKDKTAAIKFFHRRAFQSRDVFTSCIKNDFMSDKNNSVTIRQEALDFLDTSKFRVKGNSLNTIFFLRSSDAPEASEEISRSLLKNSFNNVQKDKYYLVNYKLLPKKIRLEFLETFHNHYNLSGSFINFIQFRGLNEDIRYGDDIFLIFLWVRDGYSWKIVNVTLICVEAT